MQSKAVWTITVACLVVALPNSASAFNGQRKGFILGFGLGPGLTPVGGDNKIVLANTSFKIGIGLSEQLLLYWSSRGAWYKTDYHYYESGQKSVTELFGVAGLGMSYYLLETAPAMYVTGSLGYSAVSNPFESYANDADVGLGLSMGVGYEFSPHYSVEATLANGSISHGGQGSTKIPRWSLQVTFNALAY